MADNYLENRYEEIFGRAGRTSAIAGGKGPGLETLLRKTRSYRAFDQGYKVQMLQLEAIIRANTLIASSRNRQALRFKPVTADTGAGRIQGHYVLGAALPGLHLPLPGTEPEAFIVICSTVPEDRYIGIDLGISCQSMMLKATEMGLQGVIICAFDKEAVREAFELPYEPLVLLAIGKGIEHIELVQASSAGELNYFRKDGVHYVPKLSLNEIII